MSVILTREQEAKLQRKAERLGKPAEVVLNELLEEQDSPALTARQLLALPQADRTRILRAQVERAAAEYETDLALPVSERELTAFTALEGEPFYDYPTEKRNPPMPRPLFIALAIVLSVLPTLAHAQTTLPTAAKQCNTITSYIWRCVSEGRKQFLGGTHAATDFSPL